MEDLERVDVCWRRKALAGLTFQMDGEDLTGADARLTQAAIERRLAVGLLARASFHGQADITSLLEVYLPFLRLLHPGVATTPMAMCSTCAVYNVTPWLLVDDCWSN